MPPLRRFPFRVAQLWLLLLLRQSHIGSIHCVGVVVDPKVNIRTPCVKLFFVLFCLFVRCRKCCCLFLLLLHSSSLSCLSLEATTSDYEGVAAGKLGNGNGSCYFISVQSSTKLKQILRIKREMPRCTVTGNWFNWLRTPRRDGMGEGRGGKGTALATASIDCSDPAWRLGFLLLCINHKSHENRSSSNCAQVQFDSISNIFCPARATESIQTSNSESACESECECRYGDRYSPQIAAIYEHRHLRQPACGTPCLCPASLGHGML